MRLAILAAARLCRADASLLPCHRAEPPLADTGRQPWAQRPALPVPGTFLRLPERRAMLGRLLLSHAGTALGLGGGAQDRAARVRGTPGAQELEHDAAPRPGAGQGQEQRRLLPE